MQPTSMGSLAAATAWATRSVRSRLAIVGMASKDPVLSHSEQDQSRAVHITMGCL